MVYRIGVTRRSSDTDSASGACGRKILYDLGHDRRLGLIMPGIDEEEPSVGFLEPVVADIGRDEGVRTAPDRLAEQLGTAAAADRDAPDRTPGRRAAVAKGRCPEGAPDAGQKIPGGLRPRQFADHPGPRRTFRPRRLVDVAGGLFVWMGAPHGCQDVCGLPAGRGHFQAQLPHLFARRRNVPPALPGRSADERMRTLAGTERSGAGDLERALFVVPDDPRA